MGLAVGQCYSRVMFESWLCLGLDSRLLGLSAGGGSLEVGLVSCGVLLLALGLVTLEAVVMPVVAVWVGADERWLER